jgi:dCTP deaminase
VILTDREIQTAIKKGVIIIQPPPSENAYSSTSVDLTLDPDLTIFKEPVSGIDTILDPAMRKVDTEKILESLTTKIQISSDGYILQRNKLILAYTKEYVDLRIDTKHAAQS